MAKSTGGMFQQKHNYKRLTKAGRNMGIGGWLLMDKNDSLYSYFCRNGLVEETPFIIFRRIMVFVLW